LKKRKKEKEGKRGKRRKERGKKEGEKKEKRLQLSITVVLDILNKFNRPIFSVLMEHCFAAAVFFCQQVQR